MIGQTDWHGKPYYSLDAYCKNIFSHKCYKIALNAHMTCPNRDGSLDTRGCIFCSPEGSGDFAVSTGGRTIAEQLEEGRSFFGNKQIGDHFIAYFQAYTNTYAPVPYLREVFSEALSCPDVCGISIATRPDCLPGEVLDLLTELRQSFPDKFIWIELGLQTIKEDTAQYIRRGYNLDCFEEAFTKLREREIPVIVHTILGLPRETKEDMLSTVSYLNRLQPFGIKFQLLHVLQGTDLARDYMRGDFSVLSKEEYLEILTECLAHLSPNIVVHRLTGDGPKGSTIAPLWSMDKRNVLNALHHKMKTEQIRQGQNLSERMT